MLKWEEVVWWGSGRRACGIPRIPELPWQMAAALPPRSKEYKCAADTVTQPRERCWLSSGSISLPACVGGSTQLATHAWPGGDACQGSTARALPCLSVCFSLQAEPVPTAAPLPRCRAPSCVKCNK